jgi:hypothetical protein
MSRFSVEQSRNRLTGPAGAVASTLKRSLREVQRSNGVTSSAQIFLARGVECVLVGLDGLADKVLRKTRTWLRAAIKSSEVPRQYTPGATEGQRYADLAMCTWLLESRQDQDSLNRALDHFEQGLAAEPAEELPDSLALMFQVCLEATDYTRIIRLCEQYDLFPLPPADELGELYLDSGEMCHILAHHRLGLGYTEAEVSTALRLLVYCLVEEALEYLFFEPAARWMKIVHWRGENTSPSAKDAVRLCLTDGYV